MFLSQIPVQPISSEGCPNLDLHLSSQQHVIASSSLLEACPSARSVTVTSDRGQRLNISLVSFTSGQAGQLTSYGSVKDEISGNVGELSGGGERNHHVMITVGNKAHVELARQLVTSQSNFLFDIQG